MITDRHLNVIERATDNVKPTIKHYKYYFNNGEVMKFDYPLDTNPRLFSKLVKKHGVVNYIQTIKVKE